MHKDTSIARKVFPTPDGAKIIKTETGFRGLVDGVEGKVEVFATKIHEAIAKLLHQIRK